MPRLWDGGSVMSTVSFDEFVIYPSHEGEVDKGVVLRTVFRLVFLQRPAVWMSRNLALAIQLAGGG